MTTDIFLKKTFSDKDTWGIANTPMIYNKGLAVFNGFGQSYFMWSIRLNSNIQKIFKQIHNTEELVVSLDGFSVFLSSKQKSPSWLHIDQNPNNMIYSIQGAYNFFPVDKDDAGFQVVPKSHLEYTPNVKHSKNWIPCPDKELHDKAVKLLIPENCFTLWNSRLIHANVGMSKKKVEFNRLTAYITYLPKLVRPNNILEKRLNAYYNSETTSHWANKCEIKRYLWGLKQIMRKGDFVISNHRRLMENVP